MSRRHPLWTQASHNGGLVPAVEAGLAIQDLTVALAALERADGLDLPSIDLQQA